MYTHTQAHTTLPDVCVHGVQEWQASVFHPQVLMSLRPVAVQLVMQLWERGTRRAAVRDAVKMVCER